MNGQDVKKELEKKEKGVTQKKGTVFELVERSKQQFAMALGNTISPERFTRIALTVVRQNPKLQECTATSLLGALMQSAQLGLEPNTLGESWIIPFKNKGVMEAQFQIGYKGLRKLFYNNEKALLIYAKEVREGDVFDFEFGLETKLTHKPSGTGKGKVTHYYAVATMKGGAKAFDVMTVAEVEAHAKRFSKAYGYGTSPWSSDFDAMAKKTLLIRVLNMLPLSVEASHQLAQDSTIKNFNPDEPIVDMSEVLDSTDYSVEDIEVDKETGEVTEKQVS